MVIDTSLSIEVIDLDRLAIVVHLHDRLNRAGSHLCTLKHLAIPI